MAQKYPEFSQLNMPQIEQEIAQFWKDNDVFKKSISEKKDAPAFVFYEGPPSANGMPGIHHVISRTLKDMVCRYKTMTGHQVLRKAGWDTHGLPVELGVEKELGITKEDIGVKISVEEYNKKCREVVMRYKDLWDSITQKMGYWVDLENPYVTFENEYIESIWWALSQLYKRGLLYKSVSIQPYSPAAGTGLSSHELNQPGTYKDVKDTSATVLFEIDKSTAGDLFQGVDAPVYAMAWTTTPWTLLSNLALTVGPKIDYVLIKTYNPYTYDVQHVVIAQALLHKYFNAQAEVADIHEHPYSGEKGQTLTYQILKTFKGQDLAGIRYHQLIPLDNNKAELTGGDPFRIITGDFVTTEDGTGIVHTAPAFGADDFNVSKKNNIGLINLVDREGKFIEGSGEYTGRYIKNYKDDPNYVDVNVDISVSLKQRGRAFKIEKYEHSYPHCWRTDKPVIYYPLDAWFIKTTALKDKMVELNKGINWKPKATGEGRFGNWLENMVDWNLSRSRFWGTPLPIWVNKDRTAFKCIGSVNELLDEIKLSIEKGNMPADTDIERYRNDLHRPYIDEVILTSAEGEPMYREPDLIDVWFDSGAMPFAQWHFPFENKETFAKNYPADFIAEGVDQTRGWFYTLHALGSLLQESIIEELKAAQLPVEQVTGVAYKTVVSNGLVLDKNGNKMSKRLGNVVDPFDTIDRYSADATRWYLITNASPWDSLKFDTNGITEIQRKTFGTIYNTYQFFALYANVDGFKYAEATIPVAERPEMDQWILSALNSLIKTCSAYLEDYEPTQAGRAIETFVDEILSNWYVRLNRRRFWKGDYSQDKISAYQTLYECLLTLSKLMAPISPFFTDWMYKNLNGVTGQEVHISIHLAQYPQADESIIKKDLEQKMEMAQDICSLVLSLRKKENVKVRQPLSKILIPVLNETYQSQIESVKNIILSETNIKEIEYLTEDNTFINKKIKPNFKVLGKKVGAQMKEVANLIQNFSQEQIRTIESEQKLDIELNGQQITITSEDVEIFASDIPGWSVANKGALTVALDLSITEALKAEGDARELINRLQKIRKEKDFKLTDKINIYLKDDNAIQSALSHFSDYICKETLAERIIVDPDYSTQEWEEVMINEDLIYINIIKIS